MARCRSLNALEHVIYCILHIFILRKRKTQWNSQSRTHLFHLSVYFPVFILFNEYVLEWRSGDAHQGYGGISFFGLCSMTSIVWSWSSSLSRHPFHRFHSSFALCPLSTCVHSVCRVPVDGLYRRLHCHNASRSCSCFFHSLDFFNFILQSFSVVQDNRFHSAIHTQTLFRCASCLLCAFIRIRNGYFYALWTLHTNDVLFAYIYHIIHIMHYYSHLEMLLNLP